MRASTRLAIAVGLVLASVFNFSASAQQKGVVSALADAPDRASSNDAYSLYLLQRHVDRLNDCIETLGKREFLLNHAVARVILPCVFSTLQRLS